MMNRIFKVKGQTDNPRITEFTMDVTRWHMAHHNNVDNRTVRRLARKLKVATIQDLWMIAQADHSARPFDGDIHVVPDAEKMMEIAKSENFAVSKPVTHLMGRHLKDMGMKPGKEFGQIIKASEEAQDDGLITDVESAKQWVRDNFLKKEVENA